MSPRHEHPWESFGGRGRPLVFAHAAGLPPGCYRQMLAALTRSYRVVAPLDRALREPPIAPPPGPLPTYRPFGEDLGTFVDEHLGDEGPVVGMGHSVGAIGLLLAAHARRERFDALVLIDPPVFSPAVTVGFGLVNRWLWKAVPGVRRALTRQRRWASRTEVRERWRAKRSLRHVSDEVLDHLVDASVVPTDEGVRLRYPPRWEAAIFGTAPRAWGAIEGLDERIPVLVLRAERSKQMPESSLRRWRRVRPDHTDDTLEGLGHLAPLEAPARLAGRIEQWLGREW